MMVIACVFSAMVAASNPVVLPNAAETRLLNKAYAAIDTRQYVRARLLLLKADAAAPTDMRPRKELFYVDQRLKRTEEALSQAQQAAQLGDRDPNFRLDMAYALLDSGCSEQARSSFEALTLSSSPKVRAAARAQLDAEASSETTPAVGATPFALNVGTVPAGSLQFAYDASDRGDHASAITAVDTYLTGHPGDARARLQRAYELLDLGRQKEAHALLTELERSPDADVATAAREQLTVERDLINNQRGTVYSYYQREGRFGGDFYGMDVVLDGPKTHVQPYLALHLANDVGNTSAPLRQTLTDQTFAIDVGMRMKVGRGGSLYAEAGERFGLAGQGSATDARFGYSMYRDWGKAFGSRSHTTVDFDAASYSRYAGNIVGYAQASHDFVLRGPVRGIVEINLAADSHRLFYNNTAEAAAGVQVGTPAIALRLLRVQGFYTSRGADRPAASAYGTWRTQLLLSSQF